MTGPTTLAPRRFALAAAVALAAALAPAGVSGFVPAARGQTAASVAPGLTAATRAKLDRRVSLDLSGVPLREALLSVRQAAGLNLVIGQEVAGTVDIVFRDAAVHEVLDTLLLARGLGYRPVGDGLVILPIGELGAANPLIASAVIPSPSVEPSQLLPIVEGMLSPEGRAHAMAAGRAVVVFDYPARLEAVRLQVDRLNAAAAAQITARTAADAARAAADAARRPAAGLPGAEASEEEPASAVVRLLYVPPAEMAVALEPLLSPVGRVSAMTNEGRLLILDRPSRLRAIRAAVEQLDVPRVQVRIRALIYDCSVEDSRNLGLNYNGALRGRGFAADGSPLRSLAFSGITAAGAGAPGAAAAAGGLAVANSFSRYMDLGGTLKALNESKDSRLLADPNVVVLNHERADIKIVTEVPFQQLTQTGLGGAIGTTEFREAGVSLEVTPHIAPDGTVTMLVHPEFSVLSGFTPDSNAPIIDTREATTTVRIRDRETLVLGGLRQRSKVRGGSSLPLLGDIPLAGRLFRRSTFEVRESELLVFLTPEIVGTGYAGDCREAGLAVFGRGELAASPLCPVPMGTGAALVEERRENRGPWFGSARRWGSGGAGGSSGVSCDVPAAAFALPEGGGLIGPGADETAFDPPPPPADAAPAAFPEPGAW